MGFKANFEDIFLILHVILLFVILLTPLFVSKKFIRTYGKYIASFMFCVIISWIIFGKCPLGVIEKSNQHGSFITFLNKLGINTTNNNEKIKFITGLIYSYCFYFYTEYNINAFYFIVMYNIYVVLNELN